MRSARESRGLGGVYERQGGRATGSNGIPWVSGGGEDLPRGGHFLSHNGPPPGTQGIPLEPLGLPSVQPCGRASGR